MPGGVEIGQSGRGGWNFSCGFLCAYGSSSAWQAISPSTGNPNFLGQRNTVQRHRKTSATVESVLRINVCSLLESGRGQELRCIAWIAGTENAAHVLTNKIISKNGSMGHLIRNNMLGTCTILWATKKTWMKQAQMTKRGRKSVEMFWFFLCHNDTSCFKFSNLGYFWFLNSRMVSWCKC